MTQSGHSERGHAELRLRLTSHGGFANARTGTTVTGVARRFGNARASTTVAGVARRFGNARTSTTVTGVTWRFGNASAASTLRERRRGENEKGSN
jgi:hypothetical protein